MRILIIGASNPISKSLSVALKDHEVVLAGPKTDNLIDLTKLNELSRFMDAIYKKAAWYDLIIITSGVNYPHVDSSSDSMNMIKINFLGHLSLIEHVRSKALATKKPVHIIVIGSMKAFEPSSNPIYGATKAALTHSIISLASDSSLPTNLTLSCVSPGVLDYMAARMSPDKARSYAYRSDKAFFHTANEIAELIIQISHLSRKQSHGKVFLATGNQLGLGAIKNNFIIID